MSVGVRRSPQLTKKEISKRCCANHDFMSLHKRADTIIVFVRSCCVKVEFRSWIRRKLIWDRINHSPGRRLQECSRQHVPSQLQFKFGALEDISNTYYVYLIYKRGRYMYLLAIELWKNKLQNKIRGLLKKIFKMLMRNSHGTKKIYLGFK